MRDHSWHSIKRLRPNLGEIVVVILDCNTPTIAKYDEMGFVEDGLLYDQGAVTHWMPLPPLPKSKAPNKPSVRRKGLEKYSSRYVE